MTTEGAENWEGWAIVELLGHRKLAGYIGPAPLIGGMLRLDMFAGDSKEPVATQFYSPNAFYCITPASEEVCRAYMRDRAPQPVARYELPALESRMGECPACNCYPCQCDNADHDDGDEPY